MKHKRIKKAEKCGVCFFTADKKQVFTTVKTSDKNFDKQLLEKVYFPKSEG